MGKHLLIFSLSVAALTAGCATKPIVPPNPGPLPLHALVQQWETNVDRQNGDIKQLFVREEFVFAYTTNGTSYVLSRDTGMIFHYETMTEGGANLHPPILLNDKIIYPTLTMLETYERQSGRFSRTIHLPMAIRSNAAVSHDELFCGADLTGGGRLVCLDLSRSYVPVRWALMFPGASISAGPAVFNDVVFGAGESGNVAAIAADNREPVWDFGFFQTGGPVYGDLKADESGVYVACADSKLYCINRISGKVKWQYFSGTPLKESPQLTKDSVFQFVPDTGLVALDKVPPTVTSPPAQQFNRQPRWVDPDATKFLAEDKAFVYVASKDGHIVALDKATGAPLFTSKRNDFVAFAVNLKDGIIFGATQDNHVIAITTVATGAANTGQLVQSNSPAVAVEN